MQSRWEKHTIAIADNASKMRLLSGTVTQGAHWIQQSIGVFIIIMGVYLISQGELSQGGLIAAYLLSARALAPVSQVAGLISQYHNAASAMGALEQLMSLPTEKDNAHNKFQRQKLGGKIELKDVEFAYPGLDKLALDKINITIEPGDKVALVGKNGAGKSTIEKILLGLYTPTTGQVLIDDVDLQQQDLIQIRKNIGYVPQDVSFLADSLKQNVTGGANFSDETVLQVLTQVGLLPMVQQHPDGLMMSVGERGQSLSGGQRQALAIARALIHNPSILVMDEPTASLDHSSEEQIRQLLAQVSQDKTLILITHRSPLLSLVDKLIVLDKGKVVASGPKDEVIEALGSGKITGAV